MAVISSSLTNAYTFQTSTGVDIADEYITVAGLVSGDNTVNLPAAIVNLPIEIMPVTCPDDVVITVKSWAQVTMTPASPVVWAVGTAYIAGTYVTYNGILYVAIDNTTGNVPNVSPTKWMLGNVVMTQVILNAANTASSGCLIKVRVGTD